jgi:hypothetical protein
VHTRSSRCHQGGTSPAVGPTDEPLSFEQVPQLASKALSLKVHLGDGKAPVPADAPASQRARALVQTVGAPWVTLIARWVTLIARWVTLIARWVTLIARWVTLIARWVTLIARWVTLRARWVTLRARWVTLIARWVTLRARCVTLTYGTADVPALPDTSSLQFNWAPASSGAASLADLNTIQFDLPIIQTLKNYSAVTDRNTVSQVNSQPTLALACSSRRRRRIQRDNRIKEGCSHAETACDEWRGDTLWPRDASSAPWSLDTVAALALGI